jgi:hypothetical protein
MLGGNQWMAEHMYAIVGRGSRQDNAPHHVARKERL